MIVPDRIRPMQTPRPVVSKCSSRTPASLPDASIRHSYQNPFLHLHLPVMASSQTLSTQHLLLFIKPIWVIRMRMVLLHHLHPPVVLRQREGSVSCVWVQCEITGIYRTEERRWIRTVCLDVYISILSVSERLFLSDGHEWFSVRGFWDWTQ